MATNIINSNFLDKAVHTVETLPLNAVTATGASSTYQTKVEAAYFTWQITATGSPTTVSCALQVSNDGSTWTTIDTSTTTTEETRHVTGYSFKYFRANLATLSGGTTPTITVRCIVKSPGTI